MKLSILTCLALTTFVIAAPAPAAADDPEAAEVSPNTQADVLSAAAVCGPWRGICVGWPVDAEAKRRRCAYQCRSASCGARDGKCDGFLNQFCYCIR
ncbi:hypothetical protein BZA77DRAFT_300671 [Pyronema omphalodes]|nr:hypothetical protein BZA77DRAFT_300671 [Pyronema omphalodes]